MSFTETLNHKLLDLFQQQFEKRRQQYAKGEVHSPTDARQVIERCARNNALITGALNLIPGPWGLASMVPELLAVFRNQIDMVYDLAVVHGKEAKVNNELLLYIFLSSIGTVGVGVVTVKGGELLVRKATQRLFRQMVEGLGTHIGKRLAKGALGKFVPLAGAAAMAWWTQYSTRQVGERADELFARNIILLQETVDSEPPQGI